MDAMPGLVLSHVPPAGVPVNVVVVDIHMDVPPEITGKAFTVTITEAVPQVLAYEIVAVPPPIPVTTPPVPTVATKVLLLPHAPVVEASVKVVVVPTHIADVPPVIGVGAVFTLTITVADGLQPPELILTV